jgi:hypothetical protein
MLSHDKSKEELNWDHVWFRKIVYNYDESERVKDCMKFYKEIEDFLPEYIDMIQRDRLLKYKDFY